MRKIRTLAAALALATGLPAFAAPIAATLYMNAGCGCCEVYAKHLEENGFKVKLIHTNDLAGVKHQHDVPDALAGCHTMLVGGRVVEGLVPATYVHQLLKAPASLKGLSVPGMPVGAPGMPGIKKQPIQVLTLGTAATTVYATF